MKFKINYRSHWFWFILIVVVYSVYDYFDHILRPGSTFSEHPFQWLMFSVASIMTLILTTYGLTRGLEKVFKRKSMSFEVISFGLWLLLHLNIAGPLFDQIFWPHGQLSFRFAFGPFFIILGIYFVFRLAIYFINKRLPGGDNG